MAKKQRVLYQVTKKLEFEVEAVDGREAEQFVEQFVNAELIGKENGLGVRMVSQELLESRML